MRGLFSPFFAMLAKTGAGHRAAAQTALKPLNYLTIIA
jgi:hypothetical protein